MMPSLLALAYSLVICSIWASGRSCSRLNASEAMPVVARRKMESASRTQSPQRLPCSSVGQGRAGLHEPLLHGWACQLIPRLTISALVAHSGKASDATVSLYACWGTSLAIVAEVAVTWTGVVSVAACRNSIHLYHARSGRPGAGPAGGSGGVGGSGGGESGGGGDRAAGDGGCGRGGGERSGGGEERLRGTGGGGRYFLGGGGGGGALQMSRAAQPLCHCKSVPRGPHPSSSSAARRLLFQHGSPKAKHPGRLCQGSGAKCSWQRRHRGIGCRHQRPRAGRLAPGPCQPQVYHDTRRRPGHR